MSYAQSNTSAGRTRPSCAIAPHRGDVVTVQAARRLRLQEDKRREKLETHVASHRTAGTAPLPVRLPTVGWA